MSDYRCGGCGLLNSGPYGDRCRECGEDWAKAIEVPSEPAPPKVEGFPCPSCKAPLEAAKNLNANGSLNGCYGCSRCGGVWLENAASDLAVRGIDPSVLAFASVYELTAAPPTERAARMCPIGREPLAAVSVKDVVVDACRTHGTWFDAGDLRKLADRLKAERAGRG